MPADLNAGAVVEGQLTFRPGRRRGAIGPRPAIDVQALLAGRAPQAAGQMLAALFSLCGGAHWAAAALALAAARGECAPPLTALRSQLERQTLAEHLRRIWLDWPRHLGAAPPAGATLGRSPALRNDADAGAVRRWLGDEVFGTPLADWFAAWQDRDDRRLQRWLTAADTVPARLLRPAAELARRWLCDADPPLLPPDARGAPAPAAAPPHETGSWTRRGAPPPRHALDRLLARLAEIARLAQAPTPTLELGALAPGAGRGIGWCEMARGLLVHELELDAAGTRIAAYRVLAPTEWNFHPRGVAARALALLPADAARAAPVCALIACALDPCVAYRIDTDAATEAYADA